MFECEKRERERRTERERERRTEGRTDRRRDKEAKGDPEKSEL